MTDRDPKEGPPAGQQQAPGPPPLSGMPREFIHPPGLSSSVSASSRTNVGGVSSVIKYGPQVDITASMIGGDRSRSEEPQKIEVVAEPKAVPIAVKHHEEVVLLAGPMKNWDPLYLMLIALSLATCICAVCAIFLPFSFTITNRLYLSTEKKFSLFDSKSCGSFSDDIGATSDEQTKKVVCYGSDGVLGNWVLATQVLGCIGLALGFITLVLQLINMCVSPRSRLLHSLSLFAMACAGFALMFAGHLGHNRAVWTDVPSSDSYDVRVGALGSGLFLVCTILSSWSCVITHVTSHGPGPLSMHTQFLHTYQKEKTAVPTAPVQAIAQPDISEEPPIVAVQMPESRKESVTSTSV